MRESVALETYVPRVKSSVLDLLAISVGPQQK